MPPINRATRRIIAAAAAAVILAGLLVVLYASASHRGRLHHCRNNLRQLGLLAMTNEDLLDPGARGRRFWQEIREVRYKSIRGEWQPIHPDPFVCPVLGATVSNREDPAAIDYRGPDYAPFPLSKERPLGADREGNHRGGGHVLWHDTSVKTVNFRVDATQGPAWAEAARWLKD